MTEGIGMTEFYSAYRHGATQDLPLARSNTFGGCAERALKYCYGFWDGGIDIYVTVNDERSKLVSSKLCTIYTEV